MPLGTAVTPLPKALGPARLWHRRPAVADTRPPVLLVHGGYHGAWCWDGWVARLDAAGREVAALDLRGHGGLTPPPDFCTTGMAGFAVDVVAAIDALGRPPVLAGHSLGGLLVALAATQRRVAALLLVCPSPPGNLPGAKKVPLVPEDAPMPPLPAAVARSRYAEHLSDVELAALASRLCAESPRLLNDRYDLRIPVDPAAIDAPMLVVEGGRDDPERHPPGQDRAIAAFYGAAHIRLDDAPHDLMLGPGSDRWFDTIWAGVARLPGAA